MVLDPVNTNHLQIRKNPKIETVIYDSKREATCYHPEPHVHLSFLRLLTGTVFDGAGN